MDSKNGRSLDSGSAHNGRTRPDRHGDYIRFAALGDSATFGLGDPVDRGWRGWASLLTDAIGAVHQVSLCNLATPGATVRQVRLEQLRPAVEHQPSIASLVVGLNDVMRSAWDPGSLRDDLLVCARQLAECGALVITARFHDHGRAMRLPQWLSRPMAHRIDTLNQIYDEVHEQYGIVRIDLGQDPATYDREFWAADRLHPSEHGHRRIAAQVATMLNEEGLDFEPPSQECTASRSNRFRDAQVLVTKATPWVAQRLTDLAPSALRFVAGAARQSMAMPRRRTGAGIVGTDA